VKDNTGGYIERLTWARYQGAFLSSTFEAAFTIAFSATLAIAFSATLTRTNRRIYK
jgi:hypothetical protein